MSCNRKSHTIAEMETVNSAKFTGNIISNIISFYSIRRDDNKKIVINKGLSGMYYSIIIFRKREKGNM